MPVFCTVYECSNWSNRENTRNFYRVRKCIKGKVKKLTEKRRKKWLVNLHLQSAEADRTILVFANNVS